MTLKQTWDRVHYSPLLGFSAVGVKATGTATWIEGTTAFFRHEDVLDQIIDYLEMQPAGRSLRILFAPSSVGCEAYSFVMRAIERGLYGRFPTLQVDALDIDPQLLDAAKTGVFPKVFIGNVHQERRDAFFTPQQLDGVEFFALKPDIKNRVAFLPAADLAAFRPEETYDVAVCSHLLEHLHKTPDIKRAVMGNLLRLARLVAFNDGYDVNEDDLRAVFSKVSRKSVFAPLGFGMMVLPPVSPKAKGFAMTLFMGRPDGREGAFIFRTTP